MSASTCSWTTSCSLCCGRCSSLTWSSSLTWVTGHWWTPRCVTHSPLSWYPYFFYTSLGQQKGRKIKKTQRCLSPKEKARVIIQNKKITISCEIQSFTFILLFIYLFCSIKFRFLFALYKLPFILNQA